MTDEDDHLTDEATHLTPEQRRGPTTLHVALALLVGLFVVAVVANPESVLPRDTTVFAHRHSDTAAGIDVPVPVGWEISGPAPFGTTQITPEGGTGTDTRLLVGTMDSSITASAISSQRGASAALAETIQQYVLGLPGARDDLRVVDVSNDVGAGAATSYVIVPPGEAQGGGLVYAAVFGTGPERAWVAYYTSQQTSAPGPRWVDRFVAGIQPL